MSWQRKQTDLNAIATELEALAQRLRVAPDGMSFHHLVVLAAWEREAPDGEDVEIHNEDPIVVGCPSCLPSILVGLGVRMAQHAAQQRQEVETSEARAGEIADSAIERMKKGPDHDA